MLDVMQQAILFLLDYSICSYIGPLKPKIKTRDFEKRLLAMEL